MWESDWITMEEHDTGKNGYQNSEQKIWLANHHQVNNTSDMWISNNMYNVLAAKKRSSHPMEIQQVMCKIKVFTIAKIAS